MWRRTSPRKRSPSCHPLPYHAAADDVHIFGDNEFRIRALAHQIAAKAIEQRLAQKKTDTKAPA